MMLLSVASSAQEAKQYSQSSCILLQQQIDDYKRRLGRNSAFYINAVKKQKRHCQQPIESRVSREITRAKQLKAQAEFEAQQAAINKNLAAEQAIEQTQEPVTQPVLPRPEASPTTGDSEVEFYTAPDQVSKTPEAAPETSSSSLPAAQQDETPIVTVTPADKRDEHKAGDQVVHPTPDVEILQQPNFISSLVNSVSWTWMVGLVGLVLLLLLLKLRQQSSQSKAALVSDKNDLSHTLEEQLDNEKYQFVHDVTLALPDGSTTHIDHIIVSTLGIFVIDIKHMDGYIFGSEHQDQWTQRLIKEKHTFANPQKENFKHTKSLAAILDMPQDNFRSIVMFTGKAQLKTRMPKHIGYPKDMITYIQSLNRSAFNQDTADKVLATINDLKLSTGECSSTDNTTQEHVISEPAKQNADIDHDELATPSQTSAPDMQHGSSEPLESHDLLTGEETASTDNTTQEHVISEPAKQNTDIDNDELAAPPQTSAPDMQHGSSEPLESHSSLTHDESEAVSTHTDNLSTDKATSDTISSDKVSSDKALPQNTQDIEQTTAPETNHDNTPSNKKKITIGFAPPMEPRDKHRKPFTPPEPEEDATPEQDKSEQAKPNDSQEKEP